MRQAAPAGNVILVPLRRLCLTALLLYPGLAAANAPGNTSGDASRSAVEAGAQTPGPAGAPDAGKALAFEGVQPAPAVNKTDSAADENSGEAAPQLTPGQSIDSNIPDGPVEIIRDMSTLPEPVKKMREQLIEAAASGDVERLRALLGTGANKTLIMNNDSEDPIDTLKSFSGDPDGQEILAILIDILSAGAARVDAGKPDELYVWPYFVGKNLETLTPPERVDLLRIVTAGDLIGMQENGNYNFYRLGITPDGEWKFLTGGD
jgi:hypothetical protein